MTKISIVVASHSAGENIFKCLHVLEDVSKNGGAQVIVVDNAGGRIAEAIAEKYPQIRLIHAPKEKLIPHLWEIGIRQAAGDIVATTTGDFVPQSDWVEQILKAHEGPYAGIGGAIENEIEGGAVCRAIHYCRYSAYMLPVKRARVNDFAADNASYKRSALEKYEAARRDGFWESPIHAQMIRDGLELLLTPAIVVRHQKSFSFPGFMKQRFLHGRQYGADRARNFSMIRRQLYIFMSPLIPVIFLWRITRRIITKKRSLAEFLSALPVLVMFLLSWSAGELVGYLSTPVEQDLGTQLADRQA
jgi:glycosyltransferase involved in cell wall biosynthesis